MSRTTAAIAAVTARHHASARHDPTVQGECSMIELERWTLDTAILLEPTSTAARLEYLKSAVSRPITRQYVDRVDRLALLVATKTAAQTADEVHEHEAQSATTDD